MKKYKRMEPGVITYEQYMQLITGDSLSSLGSQSDLIIKRFHPSGFSAAMFNPIVFLCEYTTGKYVYMDPYPIYEISGARSLSKREMEILRLISEGLNSKQIASRLYLSFNTVNNHRKNMLQKTSCKTSPELLKYAVAHGIL